MDGGERFKLQARYLSADRSQRQKKDVRCLLVLV